jgi:hypothetical protein
MTPLAYAPQLRQFLTEPLRPRTDASAVPVS